MSFLIESLNRRKDRSIAIILGQKERDCDQYLPNDVSIRMRKVILDQINDLHDFAVDMLRSSEAGIPNKEYFDRLEKLLERASSYGE
jgi:hypothetical protein